MMGLAFIDIQLGINVELFEIWWRKARQYSLHFYLHVVLGLS
jgi:hypothetical protein